MCGMREGLVGARTKLVNMVRGWLRADGRRPRGGELSTFSVRVRALSPGAPLPTHVERHLRMIDALNAEIAQADQLDAMAGSLVLPADCRQATPADKH
jgi:hypothetical protein